jgi:hypothetical protein
VEFGAMFDKAMRFLTRQCVSFAEKAPLSWRAKERADTSLAAGRPALRRIFRGTSIEEMRSTHLLSKQYYVVGYGATAVGNL